MAARGTGSKGGYAIRPDLRTQIERVVFDLRLGEEARRYLWACIDGGPSRTVQGSGGNVVVNFHSHKMGLRLLLESRHGEHASAILLERDKDVLAYFAQPPQVSLELLKEDGSQAGRTNYTPDMLIVTHDRVTVRETRDHSRLVRAHINNPHQFYTDEQGQWHYRAAEQFFLGLGLQYELVSNQCLPAMLVENARFLEDYLSEQCPPLDPIRAEAVAKTLAERRSCGLQELLDLGFTADEVYKAVAEGVVYVDINTDRLSASSDLQIFSDRATHEAAGLLRLAKMEAPLPIPGTLDLQPGTRLGFNGTTHLVVFVSHEEVLLQDEKGQRNTFKLADIQTMHAQRHLTGGEAVRSAVGRRIADIPPAALERALHRLEALRTGATDRYSARSIARFRERTEHAANGVEKLLALVDYVELRGNRYPRLSEANAELIEAAISRYYNQPEIRGYKAVWDKYCGMCDGKLESNGQPMRPVGYTTFTQYAAT